MISVVIRLKVIKSTNLARVVVLFLATVLVVTIKIVFAIEWSRTTPIVVECVWPIGVAMGNVSNWGKFMRALN